MKRICTILVLLISSIGAWAVPLKVYDLKCEGMSNPLGIDSPIPHFSWKLAWESPSVQSAYELQIASSESALISGKADLLSTGKVASKDQVMIPYSGKILKSKDLCFWRVRVWNTEGEVSEWSELQRFSIGVIDGDTLKGEYIGAVPGEGRAALLRKSFNTGKVGETFFLHVNSLGYHEVYINGEKVSDAVLSPAVTQMDKRSLIVTYDVSTLIREGVNDIVIHISPGWYKKDTFGAGYDGALVKAELDVLDGSRWSCILYTDGSWQGCWSGHSDIGSWKPGNFIGEFIDARYEPMGMDRASLASLCWQEVDIEAVEGIKATPQMCEPNLIQESVSPVSIEPVGNGEWIIDMGKVMNAMFDIRTPQLAAGQEITASFSDKLNKDGSLEIRTHDTYIASGRKGGDHFTDLFNHHAFRYIRLSGLPSKPDLKDIRAFRIRTDYKPGASFISSDTDLNKIHDLVTYTMSNLAFSGYMVDCVHIERLGYGGDGNASTLSLQTMFDVAPLYMNWLQAWNDCIREDGGLPHTAPNPYKAGGGPYWCIFIIQAPWRTYMSYDDSRLLNRCYATMLHWLDYVDAYSIDGLLKEWPATDYRHWYLGDWLAPKGTVDVTEVESIDLVNNCALSQAYAQLIRIADILGHENDAKKITARRTALNRRIQQIFFHPESLTYGTGSQLDMVYPLLTGIVPEKLRGDVTAKLKEITSASFNDHLAVGLVGVPVLTEWATLAGEVDFMYKLLKQPDHPGYMHMINSSGTTTWESWEDPRSTMHNCYNGIGSWFYQALGGIIPDQPGYRHVTVNPQMPEGLDWVRVSKETPYGTILVSWKKEDGKCSYRLEIPSGITANFHGRELSCGQYEFSE